MAAPIPRLTSLPVWLLFSALTLIVQAQGGPTCYNSFGTSILADVQACDPSAAHSPCCNSQQGDVCLSSGLCLASWSAGSDVMFWVGGCTDSTWKDPACSQLCLDPGSAQPASSYRLMVCSNTTWCCAGNYNFQEANGNDDDCCKDAFTLPGGVGTVIRQLTSTTRGQPGPTGTNSGTSVPTTTASGATGDGGATCAPSSPGGGAAASSAGGTDDSNKTVAIVGGVLGAALAASLVAVAVLAMSNVKLRRQARDGPGVGTSGLTPGDGGDTKAPVAAPAHPWGPVHHATEMSATERTAELEVRDQGHWGVR